MRKPWTEAEDMRLRQLRGQGLGWAAVGAALGRGGDACRMHWALSIEPKARGAARPDSRPPRPAGERVKCMTCPDFFVTPNRRQVHLCPKCNDRISGGIA